MRGVQNLYIFLTTLRTRKKSKRVREVNEEERRSFCRNKKNTF